MNRRLLTLSLLTNHLVLTENQELLWRVRVEGRVKMAIKRYNAELLGGEPQQRKGKLFQSQISTNSELARQKLDKIRIIGICSNVICPNIENLVNVKLLVTVVTRSYIKSKCK